MDDWQLLRDYVDSESQAAFAELVRRHIDLVYAACLRRLRHRQDAEDATQAVFILLSRKARSIARGVLLAGWLYRAAAYVARDAVRAANVRRKHEMTAASQRTVSTAQQPSSDASEIDRALSRLRTADRDAILLRYFQGRSFQEVGRQLRISEEAARKRVSRGLERLRQVLKPAGVAVPSVAVVEITLHSAVHAAPPGLTAATLSAVAAGPAAAGAGASLAKGAMILMALSKTKAVAIGTLAVLLIGGGTVATIHVLHPSSDEAIVIPQTSRQAGADVTTVGADNWEQMFRQAYGLSDGEVIKPVKPIPARQQFWDDQCRKSGGRPWKLSNDMMMTIECDGKTFRWTSLGGMGTVAEAIRFCAGVRPYQIDSSAQKYMPEVRSDWVTRVGATADQKMAALARIASEQLGHELRFEKRRVMRDAIIVRGHLSTAPAVVTLTDGRRPANSFRAPTQPGTITDVLNALEDGVRREVVNETGDTKTRLTYRIVFLDENHIPEVLDRLAKETSLTFSIEPREMDVWFVATTTGGPVADSHHPGGSTQP